MLPSRMKHYLKRSIEVAAVTLSSHVSSQTKHALYRSLLVGLQPIEQHRLGIPTMDGLLAHLASLEFRPKTIIDVGANKGDWSRVAAASFPNARFIMCDADLDYLERLATVARDLGNRSEYKIGLLGAVGGNTVTFHKLGTGSSVFPEVTGFRKTPTPLAITTLDTTLAGDIDGPVLLKLDVQGYELEVLRGAVETLKAVEVIILEASLLEYNEGAPLISEVVEYMASCGFRVYDICGQARRNSDHALFQVDMVFTTVTSTLQTKRSFWDDEPPR